MSIFVLVDCGTEEAAARLKKWAASEPNACIATETRHELDVRSVEIKVES